ncbi:MAG: hypothetical protein NC251_06635 [Lachnoclostridium sp.]|nr:hypothetical protein [Lachnospira sp.]MCM1248091.1 hypothetical protein [Lachnoclostridium sp.]
MSFKEKDIHLMIDGMGIVFYSPETNKNIPEGCHFFKEEYSRPEDVARHIKKGDVVGFCTGSSGRFTLKFREGYPAENLLAEYPVAIRLGIDIQNAKLCVIDLFWLMEWSTECPSEQIVSVDSGYYHITLCTKRPDSGIWGDGQTIFVYLNKLDSMPELMWSGVPVLLSQ